MKDELLLTKVIKLNYIWNNGLIAELLSLFRDRESSGLLSCLPCCCLQEFEFFYDAFNLFNFLLVQKTSLQCQVVVRTKVEHGALSQKYQLKGGGHSLAYWEKSINQRGQVTEINASQPHKVTLPSRHSLTLQQLPDKATNVTQHKVQ